MSTYPYIFNVGAMALEINIPASDFDIEPELLEKRVFLNGLSFFLRTLRNSQSILTNLNCYLTQFTPCTLFKKQKVLLKVFL